MSGYRGRSVFDDLMRDCLMLAILKFQEKCPGDTDKRNLTEFLELTKKVAERGRAEITGGVSFLPSRDELKASQIFIRFGFSCVRLRRNNVIPSIVETVKEVEKIAGDIQNLIDGKKVFKTRIRCLEEFVSIVYSPSRSSIMELLLFSLNLR